ncbi:MAG: family 16 glycosylhydrolase [Anaeromyxobacter sp.]
MDRTTCRLHRIAAALLVLLAGLVTACAGDGGGGTPSLAGLQASPSRVSLQVGASQALLVTGTFSDGASRPVTTGLTFGSSDAARASVTAAGVISGVSPGRATVTASAAGHEVAVEVTVTEVTLTAIAVEVGSIEIPAGQSRLLAVTGTYSDASVAPLTTGVTWQSSAPAVVGVSAAGLLTGVAPGAATVTASVGVLTDSVAVEVTAAAGGYDPGAGWALVWSDEFDGDAVDPSSWTFDLGSGGWGNGESQYYRAENATVGGGLLTITAREEAYGDAPYTSARLQTSQKRAFTYGKFAVRAKLPYGQGLWPAFWMLGANSASWGLYGGDVPWPDCGEIDAMEMIGGLADGSGDFTTHGTLHYRDASGRNPGPSFGYRLQERLSDDFHVYEVIWTPHGFTWKVDGLAYGSRAVTADMEEFSRPMFVLLNLAVGGAWGGWADETTEFPQTYVVDYVRVYTNESTSGDQAADLPTAWHLSSAAAGGVTPAAETLDPARGTISGFQPIKELSAPAAFYSAPLTGTYDEGAWSVGVFTTSPGSAAVVRAEVFVTAADGGAPVRLGSAELDTNATGGGNHLSWFTLVGVPEVRLEGQRLKLLLTPIGGLAPRMVYNGNDFDSVLMTPWSGVR